jgi:hypothetical protein
MRKLNLRKRFITAALVVLAAAGAAVMSPAPASANIAQGFVVGTGDNWKDDWADEGPLNMSSYNHNNVVAMWQHILWADGYLDEWSDIDCWFGLETWNATKKWKADFPDSAGLGENGEAGKKAFQAAAEYSLRHVSGNHFYYDGIVRTINFWRGSDDIWTMSISGDIHKLAYGYANFDKCT